MSRIMLVLVALLVPLCLSAAPRVDLTVSSVGTVKNSELEAWVGDGSAECLDEQAGRKCWTIPLDSLRYLYVRAKDRAFKGGKTRVRVRVMALDAPAALQIDYDSYLFPWAGKTVRMKGSGKWKEFAFDLPDAGFTERCNGADFRLTSDRPLSISSISMELVRRIAKPDQFPSQFTLKPIPRFSSDRIGFAFGGMGWGPDGITPEIMDRELELCRQLGVRWIRQFPEWCEIEPRRGVYNWERADYTVNRARDFGIECLGTIAFCTDWAADAPDSVKDFSRTKYPPKDLKDLENYVYTVVRRYKGRIRYWEGWNEMNAYPGFWNAPPSGRDPVEHYVAWQKAFYRAAKRADPKCVVLTGGFADDVNIAQVVSNYYYKGLKGSFDAMNIHIYPADPRDWMSKQLQSVIKVMRNYGDGDKKIWITETGWPVDEKHPYRRSLAQQAQWAPWLASVALSYPQVERFFFFELRDRAADGQFGWYDGAFNPRPVVQSWKDFLASDPSNP